MVCILEFLYGYSRTIALFLIFITLVGIISPSSKYKNYISLILSLILIFVIITPIADFFGDSGRIESLILSMGLDIDRNIIGNERGFYQDGQRELIYTLFKEEIKKQITMVAESSQDFIVEDVDVDISDEDDNFGEILNIYLTVREREAEEEGRERRQLIRIDPIRVSRVGNPQHRAWDSLHGEPYTSAENDESVQNLINLLKDFYILSESNIHIRNVSK